MTYNGSCHCGAVTVTLRSDRSPTELGARACQCSYCRLHGASWTSDPAGRLVIRASGPISCYRFGTQSAEFLSCRTCGVVPAVVWRHDGRLLSVVRVECLEIGGDLKAQAVQTDFDAETPETRFGRRSRTWTPCDLEME